MSRVIVAQASRLRLRRHPCLRFPGASLPPVPRHSNIHDCSHAARKFRCSRSAAFRLQRLGKTAQGLLAIFSGSVPGNAHGVSSAQAQILPIAERSKTVAGG
jgi:hypothetical protein